MGRPVILSGMVCYHCGSFETCKAGFARGKQRFYCRGCRRTFRENPEVRPGKTDYKKKAGNNVPSASHLILELRAIAQEIGRSPTTTIITKRAKANRAYSLNTYYAVFGSFITALKRARLRLKYKQEFDDADRERMMGELRALRKKLKRPLFADDVNVARRNGKVSSPYHFAKAFGSVPLALDAAGAGPKKYSREEMIRFLGKLDAELKQPIFKKDVQTLYREGKGPSNRAIEREFGGWVKARRAAGIRRIRGLRNVI